MSIDVFGKNRESPRDA